MSQTDNQLLTNSHNYVIACALAALLAVTFLLNGQLFFCVIAALISALLIGNKLKSKVWAKPSFLLL